MNIDLPQAILIATAVAAVLFLIHRFAPNSAVAKATDAAIADAKKAEAAAAAAAGKIEPAIAGLASSAETEAWKLLGELIAKTADLEPKKSAVAAAQADLDAHVKRLNALKTAVATLPSA